MHTIRNIELMEVLDGRGEPTVQVTVETSGLSVGVALVPAGRSTGRREAHEVRDHESDWYGGRGVRRHLARVLPEIREALVGRYLNLRDIDTVLIQLDGTPNKSRLGGNVTAGISLAVAKAAAEAHGEPLFRYLNPYARHLPVPQMNLINGGLHAYNDTPVQEFIMLPIGSPTFSTSLAWTMQVYKALSAMVEERYGRHALNTGDEGGLTPDVSDIETGLLLLHEAVAKVGIGSGVRYGLDMAASHLFQTEKKRYVIDKAYTRDELFQIYAQIIHEREVISIEDPVNEDDLDGLARLTEEMHCQFVGDDLFVTNLERVQEAITLGAGNALLWKFNQIGTISEAFDAAELAKSHGYDIVVSERSGDTEDPAIADLAVALGASQIKTGAPVRGERTAKYNRLLNIERMLGSAARYRGERLMALYG